MPVRLHCLDLSRKHDEIIILFLSRYEKVKTKFEIQYA